MKERKIDDNLLLKLYQEGKEQKEIAKVFGCSPAAICKRLKRLIPPPLPASLEALTDAQKKFAIGVASGQTITNAALSAFEVTSRASAKTIGHRLMKDPKVKEAIEDLMNEEGLSKRYRIKRLRQHVDSPDGLISLKALDMSFKLDGSYAPEKHMNMDIVITTQSAAAYCNFPVEEADSD